MDNSPSTLPPIAPTDPQPTEITHLTAWALANARFLRPVKAGILERAGQSARLLKFNREARRGRSPKNPLDLTRTPNVDAVLIYLFGKEADTPCIRCTKGYGIFDGCIVEKSMVSGACANCAYSSQARRCNLRGKE